MMRILITGGAGFIGSNLAAYHLEQNHEVIAIDNLSTGATSNIAPFLNNDQFSFYEEDILTCKKLSHLLKGVDRIYHLAAVVGMFYVLENPIKTINVNINATLKLFELIQNQHTKKPLVIFASSSEVYGNQQGILTERSPLLVENSLINHAPYAISKLSGEAIAMTYFTHYQIPCIVLRIFNTIGLNQSGQYGMVVPRFIKSAISGSDIIIYEDGGQTRSFCDVRDLVRLMDLISQSPAAIGQIVNIGNDQSISILKLAKLIKKLCMSQSKLSHTPFAKVYSKEYVYIKDRTPSIRKLLNYTHYHFQWSLEQALKDLIAYEKSKV